MIMKLMKPTKCGVSHNFLFLSIWLEVFDEIFNVYIFLGKLGGIVNESDAAKGV